MYENDKTRQRAYKAALNALWKENEIALKIMFNCAEWLDAHDGEESPDVREVRRKRCRAKGRVETIGYVIDMLSDIAERGLDD